MVNDFITGITKKIKSQYSDKVYDSNVEQGLDTPCFFVKLVTSTSTPFIEKRKKTDYMFDVHFFPEDETDNASMMEVGDMLTYLLEYISLPTGQTNRGHDISYQIIDGVIHFNVTYSVITNDLRREASMETCETEVRA